MFAGDAHCKPFDELSSNLNQTIRSLRALISIRSSGICEHGPKSPCLFVQARFQCSSAAEWDEKNTDQRNMTNCIAFDAFLFRSVSYLVSERLTSQSCRVHRQSISYSYVKTNSSHVQMEFSCQTSIVSICAERGSSFAYTAKWTASVSSG